MKRLALLTTLFTTLAAAVGLSQVPGKQIVYLTYPGNPLLAGQQLQQAVANSNNAGKILHLAAGTYQLDPSSGDPTFGGRLHLQQGMDIVGENQYIDCDHDGVYDPVTCPSGTPSPTDPFVVAGSETRIDGSLVLNAENDSPNGLILAGLDNTISHVTMIGSSGDVIGSIHINVDNNGVLRTVVTDTVIDGGSRGIYCQNPPAKAGTTALVTLTRNVIRNTADPGIVFINANTQGNVWQGDLEYNRIYNSRIGLLLLGNQSSFAVTSVTSFRNLIESNQLGILVEAGQDGGTGRPPRPGNNNSFSLMSREDIVRNNMGDAGSPAAGLAGGVVAMAGANSTADRPWSFSNRAVLQFLNTQFQGNADHHGVSNVSVYGYWTNQNRTATAGFPTDNQAVVTIQLPQFNPKLSGFCRYDSSPVDYNPSGTNKAFLLCPNCVVCP
jgi:hypothetical protein